MARLAVHVQPGARRNEVVGEVEGVWRVRLTAPPVEGKANAALVLFLAEQLRVRRSAVRLVRGQTSREKLIEVDGLEDEEAAQRLRRHSVD